MQVRTSILKRTFEKDVRQSQRRTSFPFSFCVFTGKYSLKTEMRSGGDFKYVEGCRPCSFVCSCCDRHCYRCMSGEQMWIWENKYTRETYSILCGPCYRGCKQSPYSGCDLLREQEEEHQRWKEEQAQGQGNNEKSGDEEQPEEQAVVVVKAKKTRKPRAPKSSRGGEWQVVGKSGRVIKPSGQASK